MAGRLSTILNVQVVDYSHLIKLDPDGAPQRLKAARRELFEPVITEQHGRIYKVMPDGLWAEFDRPASAVECAIALQRRMHDRNAKVGESRNRFNIRIGIHSANVGNEDVERVAAELRKLAEPGSICVSHAVMSQIDHRLPVRFEAISGAASDGLKVEGGCFKVADRPSIFQIIADKARQILPVSRRHLIPWVIGGICLLLAKKTPEEMIAHLFERIFALRPPNFEHLKLALVMLAVGLFLYEPSKRVSRYRFFAGVVALVGGGLELAYSVIVSQIEGESRSAAIVAVHGYIGPSKANLLRDVDVQKKLRDAYNVEVNILGAIPGQDLVCEIAEPGDFLWPGTSLSLGDYEECHGDQPIQALSLLSSPVVIYTWSPFVAGLSGIGVRRHANGGLSVDMRKLTPALLGGQMPWSAGSQSSVLIADPETSNSGQLFVALLAKTIQEIQGGAFEDGFPSVKHYVDSLGFRQSSTVQLVRGCISAGRPRPGSPCSLFVGYESILADFANAVERSCGSLGVEVVYPDPTFIADHPFIAITPSGQKLLAALQDPDIQRIAAQRHGFRTLSRVSERTGCTRQMPEVQSTSLPTRENIELLMNYLRSD